MIVFVGFLREQNARENIFKLDLNCAFTLIDVEGLLLIAEFRAVFIQKQIRMDTMDSSWRLFSGATSM